MPANRFVCLRTDLLDVCDVTTHCFNVCPLMSQMMPNNVRLGRGFPQSDFVLDDVVWWAPTPAAAAARKLKTGEC